MNARSLKRLLLGLCTLCLATACFAAEAPAESGRTTRYVIGLSPFLDRAVKDDVYRRIVGFLLDDIPLNSSLWLYDAYHLRTISQVNLPNVRAFRSGKTRANQFKKQIESLRGFLAANHQKPESGKLTLDQAVRFPQFMDFVGENLVGPAHAVSVIVLGSPLYLDHKEPGFSMVDGYFPSDGHLSASREQTVFGLKERAGALNDVTVYFGYFSDPWVTEIHQEKISRFWTLYLNGQGARLMTFCGDLPTVFNAARSDLPAQTGAEPRYTIDDTQSKIEMLRVTRDLGVGDWITRDVLPNLPGGPPARTVGPMKIGIRWQGNIDLDLYATPFRGAETLFFEHTRSPEGYYFKDHRSSPLREFEFIEFESPVNVRNVQARINFYEGTVPGGPSGEIRIEFDGKIFSEPFSIPAGHGNQGRSGANQRSFWTQIDVPAILKFEPAPRDGRLSGGR